MENQKENLYSLATELSTPRSNQQPRHPLHPAVSSANLAGHQHFLPGKGYPSAAFSPLMTPSSVSSGSSGSKTISMLTPSDRSGEVETSGGVQNSRRISGTDAWLEELSSLAEKFTLGLESTHPLMQQRKEGISMVLSNPGSPSAWKKLLENEDMLRSVVSGHDVGAGQTHGEGEGQSPKPDGDRWERSLLRLNEMAAMKLVTSSLHRKSSDYVYLLLRLAKGQKGNEEKRQIFKYMKSHRIGERIASRYLDLAQLELSSGDLTKAMSVLEQGIRNQAQPLDELRKEQKSLELKKENGWKPEQAKPKAVAPVALQPAALVNRKPSEIGHVAHAGRQAIRAVKSQESPEESAGPPRPEPSELGSSGENSNLPGSGITKNNHVREPVDEGLASRKVSPVLQPVAAASATGKLPMKVLAQTRSQLCAIHAPSGGSAARDMAHADQSGKTTRPPNGSAGRQNAGTIDAAVSQDAGRMPASRMHASRERMPACPDSSTGSERSILERQPLDSSRSTSSLEVERQCLQEPRVVQQQHQENSVCAKGGARPGVDVTKPADHMGHQQLQTGSLEAQDQEAQERGCSRHGHGERVTSGSTDTGDELRVPCSSSQRQAQTKDLSLKASAGSGLAGMQGSSVGAQWKTADTKDVLTGTSDGMQLHEDVSAKQAPHNVELCVPDAFTDTSEGVMRHRTSCEASESEDMDIDSVSSISGSSALHETTQEDDLEVTSPILSQGQNDTGGTVTSQMLQEPVHPVGQDRSRLSNPAVLLQPDSTSSADLGSSKKEGSFAPACHTDQQLQSGMSSAPARVFQHVTPPLQSTDEVKGPKGHNASSTAPTMSKAEVGPRVPRDLCLPANQPGRVAADVKQAQKENKVESLPGTPKSAAAHTELQKRSMAQVKQGPRKQDIETEENQMAPPHRVHKETVQGAVLASAVQRPTVETAPGLKAGSHLVQEQRASERALPTAAATGTGKSKAGQASLQKQAGQEALVSEQGHSQGLTGSAQSNPGALEPAGRSAGTTAQAAARPAQRETEEFVFVNGVVYQKLKLVGRGGSSKVFKVISPQKEIFALKRIRLSRSDKDTAKGFLEEITLLKRLKGKSNIINLVASEVNVQERTIYMVLEYGEIDLASLLKKLQQQKQKADAQEVEPGEGSTGGKGIQVPVSIGENFLRLYWQNMLEAVHTIHGERIVHSDLKPANFMVVQGQLKLIDFGIARAIQNDTTNIMRDTQVGTLNYMAPEALVGSCNYPKSREESGHNENGEEESGGGKPGSAAAAAVLDAASGKIKVGRASDIWSLGCILYQMVYGNTPFAHLTVISKIQAITDASYIIDFPPLENPDLIDTMQRCLDRNPNTRITIPELLEHPFLCPLARKAQGAQGQVSGSHQGTSAAANCGPSSVEAETKPEPPVEVTDIMKDPLLLQDLFAMIEEFGAKGKPVDVAKVRLDANKHLEAGKGRESLNLRAIVEASILPAVVPPPAPKAAAASAGQKRPPPPAAPPPPKKPAPPPPPPPKGGPVKRAQPLVISKFGGGPPAGGAGKKIEACDIAAAAAAAARRRAEGGPSKDRARGGAITDKDGQRGRLPALRSAKDRGGKGGGFGGMDASELEMAIKNQQARLRKVKAGGANAAAKEKSKENTEKDAQDAPPWGNLLKKGLQRLKRSRDDDAQQGEDTNGDLTVTWD